MTSLLFSPYETRGVRLKNRLVVSPMCQYSSADGLANAWHMVHLGCRAVGGAGLVFTEAAAVSAEGRISPSDLGIWNDAQAEALAPITAFIKSQGAAAGIQLAHSGRKGSTMVPWVGRKAVAESDGGWVPIAPSPLRFNADYPLPREIGEADAAALLADYAQAARRSAEAGFEVLELHAGHGYLLNQFLSPLANQRGDGYGGAMEQRSRFLVEVVRSLRSTWPERLPLFVRLSITDWVEGGWDLEQSVALARLLRGEGVDLIDCSSGNIVPESKVEQTPGFQVPLADAVRKQAQIATAAVGVITDARQAEEVLRAGSADLIFVARQLLRDPYWPLRAQQELDGGTDGWPIQYQRAVNPNALK